MNAYFVDWPTDILPDLADVWLRAPDRRAVTNAEARIDKLLADNPIGNGRHLSEGLYQLRVPPLCVTYTVDVAQHRVEINSVYAIP